MGTDVKNDDQVVDQVEKGKEELTRLQKELFEKTKESGGKIIILRIYDNPGGDDQGMNISVSGSGMDVCQMIHAFINDKDFFRKAVTLAMAL